MRTWNIIIFALGEITYVVSSFYSIGHWDDKLIVMSVISVVFFSLGVDVFHSHLWSLYEIIIKNNTLMQEKKEVVQTFPHSVLIIPENFEKAGTCYWNNEFDSKIQRLNESIQSLKNIKISTKVKDNNERREEDLETDLYKYLIQKQTQYRSSKESEHQVKSAIKMKRIYDEER